MRADRLKVSRSELVELARALGLVDDSTESKGQLWRRVLRRAAVLWRLALSQEDSDEDRTEWPWTE